MFKKFLFQIHWFLGITAGLILSIMGVSGAIYSYDQQILKLINHDSYVVTAQQQPKLSPAQLYQYFQQQQPQIHINSITIASDPTISSTINIRKEGERRGYNMKVNPYTAEVLPDVKGVQTFKFILQIHRYLTLGKTGSFITGSCAFILIFFVLSGLYLRFPKKHSLKQWFFIKPKLKGRNFLWDLHAVIGTWVAIVYLGLACTGLYWSFDWWRAGMFTIMSVEQPQKIDRKAEKIEADKPNLPAQRVNTILTQTWNHLDTQLGRQYSTMTLNIPKYENSQIDLIFQDPTPQNERAYNRATYNYQTQHFDKLDLYENKKLGAKIMNSMLPVHRGSFFGPIYQFIVMISALAMPLFFITGWLLYLKRRKQKKLTQAAKQSFLQPQHHSDATHWLIIYASQTGVAEQLAWRTASSLQEAEQATEVKAIQQLTEQDLQHAKHMLFVVSTYGTGQAPDLALSFSKNIMTQQLRLSHLHYAVMALGSKEYSDSYCRFGHQLAQWLMQCHASPLFKTIEVDNANAQDIQCWNEALSQITQHQLHEMNIERVFDQWTLTKRHLLNPNSLGQAAYHLELTSFNDMTWHAGDIAEIQPANSQTDIQNFLRQHHIAPQSVVPHLNQSIEQALWNKNLRIKVQKFQNLEDLLTQLPTLPIREYSIASIPSQQMLQLVVRQKRDENGQLGLGSGWLTHIAKLQQNVALRIRTNESFHLINDDRPIICIGNGTGIAGLMSLLQQRHQQNYTANWLIFGERQRACDFFYQDIIQTWQQMGTLQRLDVAFSRDQAQRFYVQHILRENADELIKWVQQDAVIYVCGSIDGMASDVDQALIDILGEAHVDQLRQAGHYRRDVY